jgi:hypothetical protein
MLVNVILVSLITGIIIDTFGGIYCYSSLTPTFLSSNDSSNNAMPYWRWLIGTEMRSQRDEVEEEMHNNCFICTIDRETFNLHGNCKFPLFGLPYEAYVVFLL